MLGEDEAEEIVKRRRNTALALESGLIQRVLLEAVPENRAL